MIFLDAKRAIFQGCQVPKDFRAALQYVPQFRDRIFVVGIEAGMLPEAAVAECLLDLAALEDVGVKLVLLVLSGDVKDFYDWGLECEIKVTFAKHSPGDVLLCDEVVDILQRGQVPVIDSTSHGSVDASIVDLVVGLKAAKLIAITEKEILIDGSPAFALRAADVPEVIETRSVDGVAILRQAAEACHRGVPRVHVLNGLRQGVLVDELFSNEGVGTMVHADSYRAIRSLVTEDIPELLGMIGRCVRRSFLVPRNYEEIEDRIADYHVMVIDDNVVGCVALHEYAGEDCGEIACLYVKHSNEGHGYGKDLVVHAEQVAKSKALPRVLALTTRAAEFFRDRMGYEQVPPDHLPELRRQMLERSGRGSLVFEKWL